MHVTSLLSAQAVTKVYGTDVVALADTSFAVAPASIHGLVGANGAGKSTLIKILSGAIRPTTGTLHFDGSQRNWSSPADALRAGIATIHQHIPLVPTLSVMENVFLHAKKVWRHSNDERIRFAELLETTGYDIDPDTLVSELTIGRRQMVCILQALAANAKLIIMDEPTAALSDTERALVFSIMRRLRDSQGTGFVFISHFLDEILELSDQVTVLRDGRSVLEAQRSEIDEDVLVTAMVGQGTFGFGKPRAPVGKEAPIVLQVDNVRSPLGVNDVSLKVHKGEVVGIAGLLGSGRSELMHAIYGADRMSEGDVRVSTRNVSPSISDARSSGILLVPEDRNAQALFPGKTIRWNTTLPYPQDVSLLGILPSSTLETKRAERIMQAFSVKAADCDVLVDHLSGGNAQKVALGRALSTDCHVLLLDEPTVGVDIGAKAEIRAVIEELSESGVAVLVVLSDFEELLGMCSRILVMFEGEIVAERLTRETSEHELVGLASGLSAEEISHGAIH